MSMNTYILINDTKIAISDIAKMAGVEKVERCALCKEIKAGTLQAVSFVHDDDFPGIDLQLVLPEEKSSLPILLTHAEQPKDEEEVKTYLYNRSCDDYIGYTVADTRSDDEVDDDPNPDISITASGDPYAIVHVKRENNFVTIE